MKVRKLIEVLQTYDPNSEAVVRVTPAPGQPAEALKDFVYMDVQYVSAPTLTRPYRNETALIVRAK
jgi:hypothetical protein